MKKIKKFISSPKGTIAVFGAAVVLLLLSTIGGARAALVDFSENHTTDIETKRLDVSLVEESGTNKSLNPEKLLSDLVKEGENVKVGVTYPEELSVQNTGDIDQYVRVTIYKYWVKEGTDEKVTNVYPDYIELNIDDALDNGWEVDPNSNFKNTPERTVIYYKGILEKGDSVQFADGLTINSKVATIASKDENGDTKYDYEGLEFRVEVKVDAVQTHNAADAILSTWGCKVNNDNPGKDGVLNELSFEW